MKPEGAFLFPIQQIRRGQSLTKHFYFERDQLLVKVITICLENDVLWSYRRAVRRSKFAIMPSGTEITTSEEFYQWLSRHGLREGTTGYNRDLGRALDAILGWTQNPNRSYKDYGATKWSCFSSSELESLPPQQRLIDVGLMTLEDNYDMLCNAPIEQINRSYYQIIDQELGSG